MINKSKSLSKKNSSPKKLVKSDVSLDWVFISLIFGLICFGFIMVTSASLVDSAYNHHNPYFYTIKQLLFDIMAIFIICIAVFIPTKKYQKINNLWLIIIFTVLILVLIPGLGKVVNGSRRWIPLFVINVQVAEIVKLSVILFFSNYIVKNSAQIKLFIPGILKPLVVLSFIGLLLLLQPDFGSTIVVSICVLGMMFVAGIKLRWYAILISLFILFALLLIWISPYRMERVTGFLNPWLNANTSGYQLVQALISYGRGGWFGDGIGMSIQKQFYLPEANTDFITSIISEEIGVVGLFVLLSAYGALIYKCINIAYISKRLNNLYQSYIAYGIGFWLSFQVFVNVGVNIGILPTKGLTLPFISYGGSSLLAMSFALGIVLRIDIENKVKTHMLNPVYKYVLCK